MHEGKGKRVAKACLHCRKSHVKCDYNRPCDRCVKKGLKCVDLEDQRTYLGGQVERCVIAPEDWEECKALKETNKQQQVLIQMLLQELSTQKMRWQALQNRLAKESKLIATQFHSLPPGNWDKYATSPNLAVLVFRNSDQNELLGFNQAACTFFRRDEEDLRNSNHTWLSLDTNQKQEEILQHVKTKTSNSEVRLTCFVKCQGVDVPVYVELNIYKDVWSIVVDFIEILNRSLTITDRTKKPHDCVNYTNRSLNNTLNQVPFPQNEEQGKQSMDDLFPIENMDLFDTKL